MQILFIQNFYDDQPSGGAELLCHDIVKGLERLGHKIIVLSTNRGRADLSRGGQFFLKSHPVVNEEEELKKISSKLRWAVISRNNYFITKKVIKGVNPDVVYLHNLEWVTPSPLLAAVESGKKVVLHAHNHQYSESWKTAKQNPAGSIFHGFFKLSSKMDGVKIIAISQFIADELLENGFPEGQVQVIYNGLPSKFLKQVSVKDSRIQKAVFVGALSPHKGLHIAIEAIGILKKKGIILPLEIIGKPSNQIYFAELKELVSRLGIEQEIIFSGSLKREEVFEKLKTVEMLLFPSLWEEPFGLVAAEAMVNGAIVIGSNRGAIHEVVGEAGFTVEPNGEAFAETIQKMLALSQDEKEKLNSMGRKRVKELFSLEKNIVKIESVMTATV